MVPRKKNQRLKKQAMKKVTVNLTPYNALAILSLLKEFDFERPKLRAIREAAEEFEIELLKNISDEQMEDANRENAVNQMTGKSPKRKGFEY